MLNLLFLSYTFLYFHLIITY